jgi:nitroreductase
MSAPSAGNQQPWHFVVIKNRSTLDKIPDIHPHARMCLESPLAILICADLSLEKHKGFWIQDCSASCENMLLGIHALDLGAVWVGIYPNQTRVDEFRLLFSLPEKIIPFCLLPIGYPAEEKLAEDRFKEERIHYELW